MNRREFVDEALQPSRHTHLVRRSRRLERTKSRRQRRDGGRTTGLQLGQHRGNAATRRPDATTGASRGRPSHGSPSRQSTSWSAVRWICFRPGSVAFPSDSFSFGPRSSATSLYTTPSDGASSLVPMRVPTPKPSMGAPSAMSAAMTCSSRSPDARIRTSGSPPSSRIDRTLRGERGEIARVEADPLDPDALVAVARWRPRPRDARPARCPTCRAAGPRCRGTFERTSGRRRARRRRP